MHRETGQVSMRVALLVFKRHRGTFGQCASEFLKL